MEKGEEKDKVVVSRTFFFGIKEGLNPKKKQN